MKRVALFSPPIAVVAALSVFTAFTALAGCESERPRPPGGRPGDAGEIGVDLGAGDAAGSPDSGDDAGGGGVDAAGGGDAGATTIPVAACPAATYSAFPLDVSGDSTTASSQFEASCAGAGNSPDLAVVWTAPQNARYRF